MKDIKYKAISSTEGKILSAFTSQYRTWFELSDVYAHFPEMTESAVRFHLKNMVDGGLLLRVRNGVFYIIPFEYDSKIFVPDWHLLAAPLVGEIFYIGYFSALQLHGLTTQPSLSEQIVVNRQIKPNVTFIKNAEFQYVYHNEKHFFGYEKMWINNHDQVYCSDLEKTLVDSLFKPQYSGGIVETAKALHTAQNNLDFKKMKRYLGRFGSVAVIKRLGFLLELLEIENPILGELQKRNTKTVVALDTTVSKKGRINSRWGIQQNTDIETIKNAIYT